MEDQILALYGILEEHCIVDPDRDCCSSDAPDCVWCLARYLVNRGVRAPVGESEIKKPPR